MKAWYFAREDRRLQYGDNRRIVIGETHIVDCKPTLCKQGLHGSISIRDALSYAPGTMLYLVDLSGEMDIGEDKIAAQVRKYLAGFDATDLLRCFARRQALINIDKIKPYTDKYDLIVEYLQTGDKSIQSAAESAAWYAAAAAWPAAAAARSAADAARSAAATAKSAADAARFAAWYTADATWSAADATWYAARSKQNKMLIEMVYEYYPSIEEFNHD